MILVYLLILFYFTPVTYAEPARTATGGSVIQSTKSAVEFRIRNELEVIDERTQSIGQRISNQAQKIEDIIRRIDNLEPVVERTRVRTVTRKQKEDRHDRDDRDRGFGGGSGGDAGGCGF